MIHELDGRFLTLPGTAAHGDAVPMDYKARRLGWWRRAADTSRDVRLFL